MQKNKESRQLIIHAAIKSHYHTNACKAPGKALDQEL